MQSSKRYVFIGDIHGCFAELCDLLSKVGINDGDEVVSVGDIVRKGPHSERCLELFLERGYRVVVGNNEERLLREIDEGDSSDPMASRPDLVKVLRKLPLYVEAPEIGAVAVHGGLLPGTPIVRSEIEKQRRTVPRLRYVREDGNRWVPVRKGTERPGDHFWAEVWDGDSTVLYGHSMTASGKPRIEGKTVGLDTGCVYGGRLTAAVWERGGWFMVSVPARRAYTRPGVFAGVRTWLEKKRR